MNEHYDLFNKSMGSYNTLLSTMKTQEDSLEIKNFWNTNKEVHDRSAVLGELSLASKYSEMIEVLDAMAEMNEIPGKIDQLVIDKRYTRFTT